MALPWLAAVTAMYVVFRWFFARDLRVEPDREDLGPPPRPPVFVLVVVALTLAGFAIAESLGVAPAWAALAGASVLAVRSLRHRRTSVMEIARSANVSFLVFVLALGIVVQAVMLNGMATEMSMVLPSGSGLAALLVSPRWPLSWPTWSTTCPRRWCWCRWSQPAGRRPSWPC